MLPEDLLSRCAEPMSAGASLGDWLGLAAADNDALVTRTGDRWIASWAGLPVISRLDRTVCTSHRGNRRRPLSRERYDGTGSPAGGQPSRAQPSQRSLGLTLTLDRVTHVKCYDCHSRRFQKPRKH